MQLGDHVKPSMATQAPSWMSVHEQHLYLAMSTHLLLPQICALVAAQSR
jgi:hypothetical protein